MGRCPIMHIATSSAEITTSCVTQSCSDSSYMGRNSEPSDRTTQVRCGAFPPVSQQKTISPGTHWFDWICPTWKGTVTTCEISFVLRLTLPMADGPAPMFLAPNGSLTGTYDGRNFAAYSLPVPK